MRKFFIFLISLLFGIILFIWVLKFVDWSEIKKSFLIFTVWQGLVIFILTVLILILRNWVWQEILKEKNIKISFFELLKIYLASFSLRFLAPVFFVSDEIFQTLALKEKYSLPISQGASATILERTIEITINFLLVFLGILFFLLKVGVPPKNLVIVLGGIFLFLLGGISFFYFKVFKKESLIKSFMKVFNNQINNQPLQTEREIFEFFKFKKISTWKIFGISFLRLIVTYLRTWFLILFLGKSINPWVSLSILSFSFLIMMIPIPTALGSHEAIQVFVFNSFGLETSLAPVFAMIVRAAELLLSLFGIIILYYLGFDLLKKSFLEYNKKNEI